MRNVRAGGCKAFSLVEIAIVLAIVGLLSGAILAGQSLLKGQRLRAVLVDAQNYAVAFQQFKEKYHDLPGDSPNATGMWGRLNGNADCVTNSAAALNSDTGTCDGNGNGTTDYALGVNQSGETFQAWRQLSVAGYVTGKFTGLNGPVATWGTEALPGVNTPKASIEQTTYFIQQWGYFPENSTFYDGDYTNALVYGKITQNDWPRAPALLGNEAFNIDTKTDDGLPGKGTVRTMARTWLLANNAVSCTTSDSAASAVYTLDDTTPTCFLLFMSTFSKAKEAQR